MTPQTFFRRTILIALAIICAPALVVAVFDPFFVYHRPFFMKDMLFDGSDRFQNAGLINSVLDDRARSYDTIIIGTSMSQNFPVDHQTLRLTLAGGRTRELALIAEKALATGRVKTVIWEIYWSYQGENPADMHPQSPLPVYLYNDAALDDWRYFFNHDVLEDAVRLARGKTGKRKPLERLNVWGDMHKYDFEHFSSADNIAALRNDLKDVPPVTPVAPAGIRQGFPNLTHNLLPVLARYPEVRFDLYFPPVSYYGMAMKGNDAFWTDMAMRQSLLDAVKDMPHVAVHGFDLVPGIGDSLATYKDNDHYAASINAMMRDAMKTGKNRLSAAAFPNHAATLAGNVRRYTAAFMTK